MIVSGRCERVERAGGNRSACCSWRRWRGRAAGCASRAPCCSTLGYCALTCSHRSARRPRCFLTTALRLCLTLCLSLLPYHHVSGPKYCFARKSIAIPKLLFRIECYKFVGICYFHLSVYVNNAYMSGISVSAPVNFRAY